MGAVLDQFAADCHDILKNDSGRDGLEQVCKKLEKVLVDEEFIEEHLGPDQNSRRKILYEDPELGFCIIAHVYPSAKEGLPHDHGPSWAIYGQVKGATEMTEYRLVEKPDGDRPGKVEPVKTSVLTPGMALAYDVGELHSPKREGETRLIRIEGANMDNIKRDRYEVA